MVPTLCSWCTFTAAISQHFCLSLLLRIPVEFQSYPSMKWKPAQFELCAVQQVSCSWWQLHCIYWHISFLYSIKKWQCTNFATDSRHTIHAIHRTGQNDRLPGHSATIAQNGSSCTHIGQARLPAGGGRHARLQIVVCAGWKGAKC